MAWGLFFSTLLYFFAVPTFYIFSTADDVYLMPDDHPAKVVLDHIFSKSRAILDTKSMVKSGFINPYPRKFTRLVVTRHPSLEGYIIKTYLDAQRYYKKKSEHHYWKLRIQGAQAIRNFIELHEWKDQFKVPQKWIYALPETPAPPAELLRKNYILVEEDMEIYSRKENKMQWASKTVTPDLLNHLFELLNELGLHDCTSIDNIPFSKDGRIAFIDTQTFNEWPIDYGKLTPYLSEEMKHYWVQKTKTD